jgi:CMP-N-acetylneuraminic acid synthetase/ubiquinone/menaquinone biosynthesis C-methylase UbiE
MSYQWENAIQVRGEEVVNRLLNAEWKVEDTNQIFNFLDKKHVLNCDSKVLELGCGMARNLREARKRYGCRVTGFDINKDFINMNKCFFKDNCEFECIDLQKDISILSKYKSNYFDFGISYAFLMCLPPGNLKADLIREFLRVCKVAYMYEYFDVQNKREDMYDKNGDVITVWDDYTKYDININMEKYLYDGRRRKLVYGRSPHLNFFTYDPPTVIAIIPAKQTSRRLKNKNILNFKGKPMMCWAIEACKNSKYPMSIFVSSDGPEILRIAEENGAIPYKRKSELCLDHVPKQEVIRDVMYYIGESGKYTMPDIVVSLQPNSPQIKSDHIDEAIDTLIKYDRDEIFSVDKNLMQNAAFRIMKSKYVFQRDLSTNCGVVVCDLVDVHDDRDIAKIL